MSPISERECYHHQSSTIHTAAVMCISCSSMSVWYWYSTFITEHRPTHMTSSDALNSTSSISLPLLASYPVFFPLYILSRLPAKDVLTSCSASYHARLTTANILSTGHQIMGGGDWFWLDFPFEVPRPTSSLTLVCLHGARFLFKI